jgi:hypothetical protein
MIYCVYVGGTEVNDFHMSKSEAFSLANEFFLDGYDDVYISLENLSDGTHRWINYSEAISNPNWRKEECSQ